MAGFGGGSIAALGGAKIIVLNDVDGVDGLIIKDADGFVKHKLDSKGDHILRGNVRKQ